MDDDLFDDDLDWTDAVVVGSFFDFMTEQEAEERRQRKLEKNLGEMDHSELDYEEDLP